MISIDQSSGVLALLTMLFASITMDTINGIFELSAGFFVLNHCRVLHAHKEVRGVSTLSVAFFTLWGMWNLFYYTALNQPLSYYGGMFVFAANAVYVGMMLRYRAESIHPSQDIYDEHQIYLGVESACIKQSGDQA